MKPETHAHTHPAKDTKTHTLAPPPIENQTHTKTQIAQRKHTQKNAHTHLKKTRLKSIIPMDTPIENKITKNKKTHTQTHKRTHI